MADALTRRDFVHRGALLAGAAGAASVVGLGTLERALAAGGAELTLAREQTYSALVEAVALADRTGVRAANVGGATAEFARFYAEVGPAGRDSVDILLDAVESGPGGAGFARMDRRARLDQLRRWCSGQGARLNRDGLCWSALATSAVNMAALPFHPHGPLDPPVAVTV